ncbi:MAG TPA: SDR family NAD(P)-dependent oxidoreductase [Candidatus Limnocylindrales bacterium]|nr:SDR family NAD(P)-dependent oxidoreductase [Candidatus Limnocylindrales bacterium]
MTANGKAVIVGVGPRAGLGGALCERVAREGMHVFVAGRTAAKLDALAETIRSCGGRATAIAVDVTDERQVAGMFERVDDESGDLELVVYNAGNAAMGQLHDMEASFFESVWRVGCFGGFVVGREAVRRMLPQGRGTVILTGATASLRGKAATTAFASAKAGLRSLAQSMARAYGPGGIHVAHVVIDGGIGGDKIVQGLPDFARAMGEDGLVSLDGLADVYWFLHRQPRAAWTHELDVRPFKESW